MGTLYLVATPIGNLDDITLRALQVLESVPLIAAEDTRHTVKLLTHFGLRRPMVSLHAQNEARQLSAIRGFSLPVSTYKGLTQCQNG